MQLAKFLPLLIILAVSWAQAEVCVKPLNVIFYAGNRYFDGFGDLSLNKSVIDQQIADLHRKYGECVKINIGFLNERFNAVGSNTFDGLEANKVIYTDSHYSNALYALTKGDAKNSGQYLDKKTGITFWAEEKLNRLSKKGVYDRYFDLGIMASETSTSLPKNTSYHIPGFAAQTNLVTFQEYSASDVTGAENVKMNKFSANVDSNLHLDIRIKAGLGNAGILIDQQDSNLMNRQELKQWLQKSMSGSEQKFVAQNIGVQSMNSKEFFESENLNFITSYLNGIEDANLGSARAYQNILTAYFDSKYFEKVHPNGTPKKYVLFSNMLEKTSRNDFLGYLQKDGAGVMPKDFESFLNDRIIVLAPGKNKLTVREMRSLFDPKNGAIFSQISGYGTLNDVLSVGGIPIPKWREYHDAGYEKAIYDFASKNGYSQQILDQLKTFLDETEKFNPILNEREIVRIQRQVEQYHELEPLLQKASHSFKSNQNLHHYIQDVIDQFYQATQDDPSNIATSLIERAYSDQAELQKSAFLRTLIDPEAHPEKTRIINCLVKEFILSK